MKVKVRAYRPYTGIQHRMQDTAVFQDSVYSNSEEMKCEFVPIHCMNNFGDHINGSFDLQAYSEGVKYYDYNCENKATKVNTKVNSVMSIKGAFELDTYRILCAMCGYNRID